MAAADSLHQSIGALSFPVAAGNARDFADIDPARDILLELLAAAIIAELAPRWYAVTNGVNGLFNKLPVQTKLPFMPEPEALQQVGTEFPLLAVSRADSPAAIEEFSIDRGKETWRWDVDYILGPLTIGNSLALREALLLVGRTIVLTMRDCGHRAYATQTSEGFTYVKNVLGAGSGCCNFSSSKVIDYKFGVAQLQNGGPKYHAASVTLETVELTSLNASGYPDAGSYRGTSATLATGTEQGIRTLVVADSAVEIP